MPRLSKKQYWKYHKTLKYLWENDIGVYARISPARQRQLHDFFQPSKGMSREELLAYRKQIAAKYPNLPHQAGWALKQLQKEIEKPAVVSARLKYAQNAGAKAREIIRPEIDTSLVGRAYLKKAFREAGLDLEVYEKRLRDGTDSA
jgi:hypothetical protein